MNDSKEEAKQKGFGGAVSLDKVGVRSLCVLLVIFLVSSLWVGWRFYRWSEGRELRGCAIALAEGRLDLAFERFEGIDQRAVDQRQYDVLKLKLFSITDPELSIQLISEELKTQYSETDSFEMFDENLLNTGLMLCIRIGDSSRLEKFVEIANSVGLKNASSTLVARSWLSFQEGDSDEAIGYLKEALDLNPYHREAILLRSQVQVLSDKSLELNAASVSLKEIAVEKDSLSLDALLTLSAYSNQLLRTDEYSWVVRQLKNHPYVNYYYKFEDANVLRHLVRLYYRVDPEFAYHLSSQLLLLSSSVPDDWLLQALVAFQLNDKELILTTLEKADALGANSDRVKVLNTRFLFLNGGYEECLNLCLEGIRESNDEIVKDGCFTTLSYFIREDLVPLSQQKQAVRELLSWNGASINEWIQIRELAWLFWPEEQDAIVHSIIENTESNYRLPLGAFLFRKGLFQETINLLDRFEEIPSSVSFELHLLSLLNLGNIEGAYALIEETKGLNQFEEIFARLRIGNRQGISTAEKSELWKNAEDYVNAFGSKLELAAIGTYAISVEEYKKGDELLRLWFESSNKSGQTSGDITIGKVYMNRLLASGRTREAKDLVNVLKGWDRSNTELQFVGAYLSLILSEKMLEAKDSMRTLFEGDRSNYHYRVGWAFANLKTGQESKSLEVLKNSTNSDDSVYPILQYAIFAKNGEIEKSNKLLERITGLYLLPEEQDILNQFDKNQEVE